MILGTGPLYIPKMKQARIRSTGQIILTTEKRGTPTCPSVTLPITNPTWTDQGPNPGFHGVNFFMYVTVATECRKLSG